MISCDNYESPFNTDHSLLKMKIQKTIFYSNFIKSSIAIIILVILNEKFNLFDLILEGVNSKEKENKIS